MKKKGGLGCRKCPLFCRTGGDPCLNPVINVWSLMSQHYSQPATQGTPSITISPPVNWLSQIMSEKTIPMEPQTIFLNQIRGSGLPCYQGLQHVVDTKTTCPNQPAIACRDAVTYPIHHPLVPREHSTTAQGKHDNTNPENCGQLCHGHIPTTDDTRFFCKGFVQRGRKQVWFGWTRPEFDLVVREQSSSTLRYRVFGTTGHFQIYATDKYWT